MSIFDIDPLWFSLGFCGFLAWLALMLVLFIRDGAKVIEPEPVEHSDGTPDYAAFRSSVERAAGQQ